MANPHGGEAGAVGAEMTQRALSAHTRECLQTSSLLQGLLGADTCALVDVLLQFHGSFAQDPDSYPECLDSQTFGSTRTNALRHDMGRRYISAARVFARRTSRYVVRGGEPPSFFASTKPMRYTVAAPWD